MLNLIVVRQTVPACVRESAGKIDPLAFPFKSRSCSSKVTRIDRYL